MSARRFGTLAALMLAFAMAAAPGVAAPIKVQGPGSATTAARTSLSLFAGAYPVQLVETVPIETTVGHGGLPRAREVWIEMIGGARDSIDLEGFYLSTWSGEPLEGVITALGEAARRGVKVRVLLDKGMGTTYPQPADSLAKLPGFELRWIDMKRIAGGIQHSKYFLIDGEQTYFGSQNFDWRSLKHIHELGVRVRDRRVTQAFGEVFAWDWQAADTMTWIPGPAAAPSAVLTENALRKLPAPPASRRLELPIRIEQSPGDTVFAWPSYTPRGWIPDSTRWDLDAIVRLIDQARHELVVQLLTYSPEEYGVTDSTLDDALRRAAKRGVHVKLAISDWIVNGRGLAWLQRLSRVPNVEVKLVTYPEWSGGYIAFARVDHCKYAVADTAVTWIGTANWGPGYFHGSRNLALTLENRPLATDARRVFESVWASAYAAPVRVDFKYAEKIRGTTPPPGKKAYGN